MARGRPEIIIVHSTIHQERRPFIFQEWPSAIAVHSAPLCELAGEDYLAGHSGRDNAWLFGIAAGLLIGTCHVRSECPAFYLSKFFVLRAAAATPNSVNPL